MGFEAVALFAVVDLQVDAPVGGMLDWFTDLPGFALTKRYSVSIPATIGRRTVRLKLPGPCKGTLYYPQILTNGKLILYGARVYARVLPGDWQWYAIPVIETGEWQPMKLPIPPTPEEWQPMKLPIPESAVTPDWVTIPVDSE